MAEHRRLTPEFVDAVPPPERGERWIGDTDIRGFGLRLWATRTGAGKAFAIRTSVFNGKDIRLTFDLQGSIAWRLALPGSEPGSLGSYLASARRWARQEIDRLKERVPRSERLRRLRIQKAEQRLLGTIQEIADDMLKDMRQRKLGNPYIDRLDKLLSLHLPSTVRSAPLAEIAPRDIATALSAANLSPTALHLLRAFIDRIFREVAPARPSLWNFSRDLNDQFHQLQGDRYDTRFPELKNLTEDDYEQIFQRLEAEPIYWQQAICIRLFFKFWTPFYRLMGAEWNDIVDRRWRPYPPSEWRLNVRYGSRIDDHAAALLDRARRLGTEEFGPTPYWFPSKFGRKFGHIRTVDTIWRNTLYDLQSRYYPLREVALNYRHSIFHLRSVWN